MSKYKLLLVEDQRGLREAIKIILELNDMEVFAVANGKEAITKLNTQELDLIVCDVSLPDISGYEILKELQQLKLTKKIPFLFLTAYADPAEIKKGLDEGADEYITKPFATKDLVRIIKEHLISKN